MWGSSPLHTYTTARTCVCAPARPTPEHTNPTHIGACSALAGKFPFYRKPRFHRCILSYVRAGSSTWSWFGQYRWYSISICNVFVLSDWCSLPGWFFTPIISCVFHLLCNWIVWFHGSCKFSLYPRKVGNWHYHLIVSQPLCS